MGIFRHVSKDILPLPAPESHNGLHCLSHVYVQAAIFLCILTMLIIYASEFSILNVMV